jgi:hypothetical protein
MTARTALSIELSGLIIRTNARMRLKAARNEMETIHRSCTFMVDQNLTEYITI